MKEDFYSATTQATFLLAQHAWCQHSMVWCSYGLKAFLLARLQPKCRRSHHSQDEKGGHTGSRVCVCVCVCGALVSVVWTIQQILKRVPHLWPVNRTFGWSRIHTNSNVLYNGCTLVKKFLQLHTASWQSDSPITSLRAAKVSRNPILSSSLVVFLFLSLGVEVVFRLMHGKL